MATTDAINFNQLKRSVFNIKKYVDDTVGANRIDMCTDEEIDSMLASKLVVSEDNDDLVFLETPLE